MKVVAVIASILLLMPMGYIEHECNSQEEKIINKIAREIEIPPGSDYYVRFDSKNLALEGKKIDPLANDLSDVVKEALVRSPMWIQRELARQFKAIENPGDYADLILGVEDKYVDEIAFSISRSPLGDVPSKEVIFDNARFIYENDEWIKYADIIDYDDGNDYYSTIQYRIIENGSEREIELPPKIYYWYVVHPKVASEDPTTIYGKFWRDYLFNHNDRGYPLLKEKLSNIEHLWDREAYRQPVDRTWKWSIENYPTAIEAISYWIGKSIPEQAYGDRPIQPNEIYHEHNGWCGELQRIAVAAQRTALISSVGICDIGEDHVWREFYESGWHQCDNWWADGGGAVDMPDIYEYGWKKNVSSLFGWNGDDSIYDVTDRYIHQGERREIGFLVLNQRLEPIDGARITAVVSGPLDITWLKNKIWEAIQQLWDILPEWLKGPILQKIYQLIWEKYEELPNSIEGMRTSIWNYTDMKGECKLKLGVNNSYLFIIQQGNLRKPWFPARHNAIRYLSDAKNATIPVIFLCCKPRLRINEKESPSNGKYSIRVNFSSMAYQIQKNIFNGGKGTYPFGGYPTFFIVDEKNFLKYKNGLAFECYEYLEKERGKIEFNASDGDCYIVFRNNALETKLLVDFSMNVVGLIEEDRVQIASPTIDIFEIPTFDIGKVVNISGIATGPVTIIIENESHEIGEGEWNYLWNTSGLNLGVYEIEARSENAEDDLLIRLVDASPPIINIHPIEIVEKEMIEISGEARDNVGIDRVKVCIDGEWKEAMGTSRWHINWNVSEFPLGDYEVMAKAIDESGREAIDSISITINESGHGWAPKINEFYHEPVSPNNESNVIIYANITKGNPFNVDKIILYWGDGYSIQEREMFRYADNPRQNRSEEDPLRNESNEPIYGFELGQFSTGTTITYWIEAVDTANNSILSKEKLFSIN